jgi:tRNA(adenine34) deaminase
MALPMIANRTCKIQQVLNNILVLLLLLDISNSLQLLPLRRRGAGAGPLRNPSFSTPSASSAPLESQPVTVVSIPIPFHANETEQQTIVDEYLMGLALQQAEEAGNIYGEVPIGALIAQPALHQYYNSDGTSEKKSIQMEILSNGQNQIETYHDASAHAELQALRSAGRTIQNWRLLNATLYSTLEPCPMCLSAAQAFRVARIVYGAPDLRLGAVETYINLLEYPHPFHDCLEVVGGVRSEEARDLLVQFFRDRRKKGKGKGKGKGNDDDAVLSVEDDGKENPKRTGRIRRLLTRFCW